MARREIKIRRVIGLIAAALLLAGCGGTSTPPAAPGNEPAMPGGQADMITDVKGRTVTVDGPPERVVCLVSLCEDMLLELDMRPVAVTGELISHPVFLGEEGKAVPTVPGGFLEPDVEAIIGMEPDLVIGLFQQHDGLAPALDGVAPLWIIESDTIDDSLGYLRDMGTLTGRTEQVAASEQRFRERLAAAEGAGAKDLPAGVLLGLDGDFEVIAGQLSRGSDGSAVHLSVGDPGGPAGRVALQPRRDDRDQSGHPVRAELQQRRPERATAE